jgi:hypothetical protein
MAMEPLTGAINCARLVPAKPFHPVLCQLNSGCNTCCNQRLSCAESIAPD